MKRVGVFDSGIGGLTVLEKLMEKFPNEDFIYVADQGHCPYGTKTEEGIKECVLNVGKYLIAKDVKAIVIACNTASLFIKYLQEITEIPVISVIEPTCMAAINKTENKNQNKTQKKQHKQKGFKSKKQGGGKMPKEKTVDTKNNQTSKATRKTEQNKKSNRYGKIKPPVKANPIKISFLGGLNEVGKNMTVYEYEKSMLIVDCGLAFPESDQLGVDFVIPDFSYVERNADKIKGILITHGHEDHIGALCYLLKKINVPVYATLLTAGLIMGKLSEHKLDKTVDVKVIEDEKYIEKMIVGLFGRNTSISPVVPSTQTSAAAEGRLKYRLNIFNYF